jgi:hypothetical protein
MSFTTEDLKGMVLKVLQNRFPGDARKQRIYSGSGRLNFSCPYCGDSSDYKKKRGNLYTDSLSFKCYNGGCAIFRDLYGFLKDFELQGEVTPDQITEIKEIGKVKRSTRRGSGNLDVFLLEAYKDLIPTREFLKKKLDLIELPYAAQQYLKERYQDPDDRFLWEPRKKSMFLLNLTANGEHVLGLQIKNMNKNATNKYYTYRLSGIYKNLFRERNQEIIEKAAELDGISCVFGFSTLNLESPVTIFEGPFDSFLYRNSVGLCSINNKFPFDVEDKRYFLDGDTAGREAAQKLLKEGEKVFLWKKFLEENGFPTRDKWDLNDIVVYAHKNGLKIKNLENYFSNSSWDLIYV